MRRTYVYSILTTVAILALTIAGVWNYRQYGNNNAQNERDRQYSKLDYYSGNGQLNYRYPAEFEKQQAIWLQWPSEVYEQSSHPVGGEMINIMKSLAPYIRVNVMSRSANEIVQIKNRLKNNGYTGTNVHFYIINHSSIWARDVGPLFVKDINNKLSVANFGFNNYSRGGNEYYIKSEGQVDKLVADYFKLPTVNTNLISEGGAIEPNGRGTLMLTESVILKRNPGMTKQQIENEYIRVLGIKKFIWLKKGLAEDDSITSGHINEIARFAGPNTVLLARVMEGDRYANQTSQESYNRMEENYNILRNATDQDGNPLRIIRVPIPPGFYKEANTTGKVLVRSYLNYAVTNGAVIMPIYWKTGRSSALKETEDGVKEILKGVFQGRTVIGINDENINYWGGGLHCVTQHMPAE